MGTLERRKKSKSQKIKCRQVLELKKCVKQRVDLLDIETSFHNFWRSVSPSLRLELHDFLSQTELIQRRSYKIVLHPRRNTNPIFLAYISELSRNLLLRDTSEFFKTDSYQENKILRETPISYAGEGSNQKLIEKRFMFTSC